VQHQQVLHRSPPEEIHITDNAIIPLKERVVDEYYDPVLRLVRKIRGVSKANSGD
jgi:succinate dehydrogenase / fumarate reductase iron-sulfur subunit